VWPSSWISPAAYTTVAASITAPAGKGLPVSQHTVRGRIRGIVIFLRADSGMPYAEYPFRPVTRVRYQDAA